MLVGGYRVAFIVGALFSAAAGVVATVFLREGAAVPADAHEPERRGAQPATEAD